MTVRDFYNVIDKNTVLEIKQDYGKPILYLRSARHLDGDIMNSEIREISAFLTFNKVTILVK